MQIKQTHIILVLLVALAITATVIINHHISVHPAADPIADMLIDFQHPVSVEQINVLAGDEFDLILQDKHRIHAMLDVRTPPVAKHRVLELINQSHNPRVVFKKDVNGIWIVEMYLTIKGTDGSEIEISLSKWLQDENLAYR